MLYWRNLVKKATVPAYQFDRHNNTNANLVLLITKATTAAAIARWTHESHLIPPIVMALAERRPPTPDLPVSGPGERRPYSGCVFYRVVVSSLQRAG